MSLCMLWLFDGAASSMSRSRWREGVPHRAVQRTWTSWTRPRDVGRRAIVCALKLVSRASLRQAIQDGKLVEWATFLVRSIKLYGASVQDTH